MNSDMTVPCGGGLVSIRVGAIIKKGDKFLMVEDRYRNNFFSVGGRVKFGETAEEAVRREVFEETGVDLEVERLGFVHENYFYEVAPANFGKLVYQIELYYYMKTPSDFEPKSMAFDDGKSKERLSWISADEKRGIFPAFFRTELSKPFDGVKYFLNDERQKRR